MGLLLAGGTLLIFLLLAGVQALLPPATRASRMTYECGFDSYPHRGGTDVQFYLVAVLYLVFDVELALVQPLALGARVDLGGALGALAFFYLLTLGFFVEFYSAAVAPHYGWR